MFLWYRRITNLDECTNDDGIGELRILTNVRMMMVSANYESWRMYEYGAGGEFTKDFWGRGCVLEVYV
jgi:hypothetical protein